MMLGTNVTETEHRDLMISTALAKERDEIGPMWGLSYLHVSKYIWKIIILTMSFSLRFTPRKK